MLTLGIDTDESPELFKTQIYSQTGVPPERQKIMTKGGMLKVKDSRKKRVTWPMLMANI